MQGPGGRPPGPLLVRRLRLRRSVATAKPGVIDSDNAAIAILGGRNVIGVPGYRLYFLESEGREARGIDLDCVDDAQAVAVADEHLIHDHMELWQGDRLVKRFGGPSPRSSAGRDQAPSAPAPDHDRASARVRTG